MLLDLHEQESKLREFFGLASGALLLSPEAPIPDVTPTIAEHLAHYQQKPADKERKQSQKAQIHGKHARQICRIQFRWHGDAFFRYHPHGFAHNLGAPTCHLFQDRQRQGPQTHGGPGVKQARQ